MCAIFAPNRIFLRVCDKNNNIPSKHLRLNLGLFHDKIIAQKKAKFDELDTTTIFSCHFTIKIISKVEFNNLFLERKC